MDAGARILRSARDLRTLRARSPGSLPRPGRRGRDHGRGVAREGDRSEHASEDEAKEIETMTHEQITREAQRAFWEWAISRDETCTRPEGHSKAWRDAHARCEHCGRGGLDELAVAVNTQAGILAERIGIDRKAVEAHVEGGDDAGICPAKILIRVDLPPRAEWIGIACDGAAVEVRP